MSLIESVGSMKELVWQPVFCHKQLLLLMSKCVKLIKKEDVVANSTVVALFNVFQKLNGERTSLFTRYLMEKIIISIFAKDHGCYVNLVTSCLFFSDDAPSVDFSVHKHLLNQIILEMKKNEFHIEDYEKYFLYILPKMVEALEAGCYENIGGSDCDSIYACLRLHRHVLDKSYNCGNIEIMTGFDNVYEAATEWLFGFLLNYKHTEILTQISNWFFMIKIFKGITNISHFLSNRNQCKEKYLKLLRRFLDVIPKVELCESNFCGVNGTVVWRHFNPAAIVLDEQSARSLVLSLLKMALYCQNMFGKEEFVSVVNHCLTIIQMKTWNQVQTQNSSIQLLNHLFLDQDDDVIEFVSTLFKIHMKINGTTEMLDPHQIFYEVCKAISFDENVILDWMMNESSSRLYVSYLQKYITHTVSDFDRFASSMTKLSPIPELKSQDNDVGRNVNIESDVTMKEASGLVDYSSSEEEVSCKQYTKTVEDVMSCLIRLNLKLERMDDRGLLPENLKPICNLLDQLESLYEA